MGDSTPRASDELRPRVYAMVDAAAEARGVESPIGHPMVHEAFSHHYMPEGREIEWQGEFVLGDPAKPDARGRVRVLIVSAYPERSEVESFETYSRDAADVHEAIARDEWTSTAEFDRQTAAARWPRRGQSSDGHLVAGPGPGRVSFLSTRWAPEWPAWREQGYRPCMASLASGDFAMVAFVPDGTCLGLAASRKTPWMAYTWHGCLELVNVETAEHHRIDGAREDFPRDPSMTSTEPRVYGRVTLDTGEDGWRMWRIRSADDMSLASERVDGLGADDDMVAFAPDDDRVAVLSGTQEYGAMPSLSVRDVISPSRIGAAQQVGQDLGRIYAASWLPDGERLLVVHAAADRPPRRAARREEYEDEEDMEPPPPAMAALSIVSAATGEAAELDLAGLVDPDSGDPLVLCGEQAWGPSAVALDDGRIALCMWSPAWSVIHGLRAYVWDPESGDLARLTPLEDKPIARYAYPASGEPAFLFPWEPGADEQFGIGQP
jgi:hypothetical protein